MLDYVFGFILGIISGLLPGIHPNTVSTLVAQAAPYSGLALATVICIVYIVNAVAEFIPSIFLSAPSEATSLSVLPGHRMLLEGRGMQALELALRGALLGGAMFVLLFAPTAFFMGSFLALASKFMFWILLAIVANSLMREKRPILAAGIFLLAGGLGIFSGKLPLTGDSLLFLLLTGGFGVSTLVLSLANNEAMPKQVGSGKRVGWPFLPAAAGTVGGLLVGTLPAVSPSQAVYLMSSFLPIAGEGFLGALGAVASTSFLFSLVTLYMSGKARNGTAFLVGQATNLDGAQLILLLAASLAALAVAVLFLRQIGGRIVSELSRLDYFKANLAVLVFLILLIDFWSGPLGLVVAGTSASLGVFCQLSGVKRTNLMGMLLLPTMLFYL